MEKPKYVYVIYIQSTADKVWKAISEPEITRRYWGDHINVSDWKPGSKWEHLDGEDNTVRVTGKVVESQPPERLVLTWAKPEDSGNAAKTSRVTFEIKPHQEGVRLTVLHDELDDEMYASISQGWPAVLSNLKSLLETGKPVPLSLCKCGKDD